MTQHPIPDSALEADIAILGKKGRGKTYTAKGLVERLLTAGRRVCVMDPLSTWWGLKSSADGESEGFPVAVFGGDHPDMPLTEAMARPLARLVAENNMPCILDMGTLRKSELARFSIDFLDELYARNRDPLTLVLEEADVFAPQNPAKDGFGAQLLGEVDRIARRGRAYGFRLMTLTQRPARLHKDVLTQLSTLIALGVSAPQDREAIKAWVEGNADRDVAKEVFATLASLGVGEGWVWAPDLDILERVRFPRITTLDTSATPKAGENRIEPKSLAQVDLSAVKDALAVDPVPEQPPKKRDLPSAEIVRQAQDDGYAAGFQDGLEQGRQSGFVEAQERARERLSELCAEFLKWSATSDQKVRPEIKMPPAGNPPRKAKPAKRSQSLSAESVISTAAARWLEGIRDARPLVLSWPTIGTLIGKKARGGSFNAVRRTLVDGGYVVEASGVEITQLGLDTIGNTDTDNRSNLEKIESALPTVPAEILNTLIGFGGTASIEQLGEAMRRATHGGSWNSAMKILREGNVIEGRDPVSAQDWVLA